MEACGSVLNPGALDSYKIDYSHGNRALNLRANLPATVWCQTRAVAHDPTRLLPLFYLLTFLRSRRSWPGDPSPCANNLPFP
jgi:hypothetical protein